MVDTNTTALAAKSYSEGFKTGVDHVMTDLNDLMYTDNELNDAERAAVVKVYKILSAIYPS